MGDRSTDASSQAAGIDLSQFYQVFFEEAGENLDLVEHRLLNLDIAAADDEELNAIFRCAHSVKGGAATFGFSDVAELTHEMETLLDKLRRHELQPTAAMVDVLLASGDALKAQLARHQGNGADPLDTSALRVAIRAMVAGGAAVAPAPVAVNVAPVAAPAAGVAAPAKPGVRQLELTVGPLTDPADADNLVDLFMEITDLGSIEPLGDGYGFHAGAPGAPAATAGAEDGAGAAAATGAARPAAARSEKAPTAAGSSTLRVSVEKVDQLINLVGELVITQARLAQNGKSMDTALYQQLASGLADLERNTRDLQEAVVSIRMIPMSLVFNRFPRMLRDLASKLGKKVELVTQGESTELDKGLVEKITDPLTHLVRNSCDHGIEPIAERLAKGKPEHGTITLVASHQGGSIVIEVRDDGKGLNRGKLLSKARERGIDAPDTMSDADCWSLIFAPGFSTAEVVTDVSGRGVGMDVVKKNITALGGTVEIDSAEGHGMSVRVRLPLTLAIMDGMSVGVGVGDECYILPLGSVVESFQVHDGLITTLGGSGRVVGVRDAYMPVLDLQQVFDVPRLDLDHAGNIMGVVEAEGGRVALPVDELLGQQQVVVKTLESNYRKVDDVSGATIMGDGRAALILDAGSPMRRSRH